LLSGTDLELNSCWKSLLCCI